MIQVPAAKARARLPRQIAVGPAELEILDDGTARWTKGASTGLARIAIRSASKTTTDITVTLERPNGPQAFLWPKAAMRRLEELLAQALAYEIETRTVEDRSTFDVRRTTPELVRSRAS